MYLITYYLLGHYLNLEVMLFCGLYKGEIELASLLYKEK